MVRMVENIQKPPTSGLTGFEEDNCELLGENAPAIREALQESLDVLSTQGFCVCGQYPWDYWQRIALKRGVPEELATLGRSLMREADQHAKWAWAASSSLSILAMALPAAGVLSR